LVINKANLGKRPEIKVDDFATAIGIQPLVVIPFDAQLFGTAANNGQMIAETDAKSPIAESFDLVARVVTGRAEVKKQKRSGFDLSTLLERFTQSAKKKSA
jgi:pilus assembly protein CpaE